jgi:Tfp pilus assembly protein PilP
MQRFNGLVFQLDVRQPWLWPRVAQHVLFACTGVMGALLLSPWLWQSWNTWVNANEAQAQLRSQQQIVQDLRLQTTQLLQTPGQTIPRFADATLLTQLARQEGLELAQLDMDRPHPTAASLNALQIQQRSLHFKVQGSWRSWRNWLAQWPSAAPGVTVASLELKTDSTGGISAQVLAVAPQSMMAESSFELSGVNLDEAVSVDPFSAQDWASAQRQHAERHPSYARLVAPELLRPKDVLEAFPRERLQYVGQIGSAAGLEALVKVLPASGHTKDAAMFSVHRVRVGSHLGQHFGKVLSVQSDQLVVQEVALMPTGEWQTREVRLPLHEATP